LCVDQQNCQDLYSPMPKQAFSRLTIHRKSGHLNRGWLIAGPHSWPVILGRSGIKANKREGDGGTPRGSFRPKRLWWRADRHPCPPTLLPTKRIRVDDGWCESPQSRQYNRPIKVSPGRNADRLARVDGLYDFIVEINHNTRPRIAGRGSAVFIHVMRKDFAPTAGCIALTMPTLRRLLASLGPHTWIVIE
jgi:L,D-peptidoglycan transpeptidase YkuD (ErfK/YbiS/YcfS/YnhG family)